MTRTLLIFDIDGTIVDSADMIIAAQAVAFAACGVPAPPREASLAIVGLSLPETFAVLAPGGPVAALEAAYRDAAYRMRNEATISEPLFPGMGALIAQLHTDPRFTLAIATGKARRGVNHLLRKQGWEGYFASIQTADDAPSKPDPGMIHRALAETGVPAGNALMIGDSSFDMIMAKRAGIYALGVGWGFQAPDRLRAEGADAIAADAADLRRRIDSFAVRGDITVESADG
ncbi:MAG: HAD-IA family hydrolase [Proteobacteria bacterium]|nr:HAD-IA family hydrolase [Pseudomonadota bacterium]